MDTGTSWAVLALEPENGFTKIRVLTKDGNSAFARGAAGRISAKGL
jgi:hypothetical protein